MRKTILTALLATSLLSTVAAQDGIYTLSGGVVTLGTPVSGPIVQAPSVQRTQPNLVPVPATIYTRTQTPTITWPQVQEGGAPLFSIELIVEDSNGISYIYEIPNVEDTSFTLPDTNVIAEGPYTVTLSAIDIDENRESAVSTPAFMDTEIASGEFDFNSVAPLISNNLQPTLTGTFDINPTSKSEFAPLNNVEIQVRRASVGFFSSVSAAPNAKGEIVGNEWTKQLPMGFLTPGEGVYDVAIRVIDQANNPVNPIGVTGVRGVSAFNSSLIVDFTDAVTSLTASTLNDGDVISMPETFTVTFTDATRVSGFDDTDVLISGTGSGTVSDVQFLGMNTWSFRFTPTTAGALSLQIPAAAVTDQGNNPSAASNIFNLIADNGIDNEDPIITGPLVIQRTLPSGGTPPPTWVRNQTPNITWASITDNDEVTSVTLEVTDSGNNTYSYPINPVTATSFVLPGTDILTQGEFTAELFASDAAGNTASIVSNVAFMDTIIPTSTVTGVSTAVPIITNDPSTINFNGTYNDDPGNGIPFSGLRQMEVQISRRNPLVPNTFSYLQSFTVSIPSNVNASGNWVFNFLPTFPPLPQEGFYNLNIRAVDRALNPNGLPSGTGVTAIPNGILYDISDPVLIDFYAESSLEDDCVQNPETFFVVYDDISVVSGFDVSDVTVSGLGAGIVSDVESIGNNTFTFLFTSTQAGDVTITINDDAVEDQAGNIGGGTLSLDFIADLTPPDILCPESFSVVGSPVQGFDPNNPASVFFSVIFDEPVTNLIPENITLSGAGTVGSITPTPGFDTTFVIEVVPSGLGTISVGFVNLVIEDCAGNLFDSTGYEASVELVPLLSELAQPALLLPNDPNTLGKFGQSVDLDQGITIVGYPSHSIGGAAVVFEDSDATTKTQTALLLPENPAATDRFGAAVAHDGFWALVSAPFDDAVTPVSRLNSGSATFFKRSEVDGTYSTNPDLYVFSDTPEANGQFGTSVALRGNYAIIGEPFGRNGGNADIFVLDVCNGTWSFQQTITANDISRYDSFGSSVAIDGNIALVGSPRDDDNGSDSGSVYVFVRSGSTWSQASKIVPGNNRRGDKFGQSLDFLNDRLAVGAPGYDFNSILNNGSAYLYNRISSTNFVPSFQLNSTQLLASDSMGEAIALNAVGDVIVGAPLSNILGVDAGAAFLFSPNDGYSTGVLFNYLDGKRNNYFGEAVGISQGYAIGLGSGASHPDALPNSESLYPVTTGVGLLTSFGQTPN